MNTPRFRRRIVVTAIALAAGVVLAGCTSTTPTDTKTGAGTTAEPTTATTKAPDAVFVADGSADDNLPVFTKAILDQWAGGAGTTAKRYTDALIAVGFDPNTIEATASKTTLGNDVESLQVGVLWQGKCILGQVGPSTGDPITLIMPELADGGCFVGTSHHKPE